MPVATREPLNTNSEIVRRSIRHALNLERVKAGETKRILKLLDTHVVKDLTAQLSDRLEHVTRRGYDVSTTTSRRLEQLMQATRATIATGMTTVSQAARSGLAEIAITEAEFQASMMSKVLPINIDWITPATTTLRAIVRERPFQGALTKQWYNGLARSTQNQLQRQMQIGLAQGESVPALMKRVRGAGGVVDATRRNVEAIVRTSTQHVVSHARELSYEENDDLISGVQWVSTLDSRTSLLCVSLDGKVFPLNEGPRAPAHWNCRSSTVPVIKSWRELGFDADDIPEGTRKSMDGEVSAKVFYPEWLKSQTEEVQNEVLGKGKAELFRSGKLDLSKFNGQNGRPLTLKQLREREGLDQ